MFPCPSPVLLCTFWSLISVALGATIRHRDGGDVNLGIIPGSVDDTGEAPDETGSSGKSDGSINLSKGAQIAIIVVAIIVAIIGITSAVLFYLAKKRQWEIRASIRRSARRLTGTIRPRTPRLPGSRNGTAQRYPQDSRSRREGFRVDTRSQHPNDRREAPHASRRDLEKAVELTNGATVNHSEETENSTGKGWKGFLSAGRGTT
ncbi:hypothetical protein AJ80_06468 [Polytolypa hystricis UAMH7299]|uniref:Mid2 domain-containing protein n=1 Tax=Polytolypa hystricis (strain UAMH7299) TaxID=1447883 RepID=A0A2B7XV62_POLH7|nr:hypothetical protein AJ80_06468 [Polytolypa hystricis UAMH7299]